MSFQLNLGVQLLDHMVKLYIFLKSRNYFPNHLNYLPFPWTRNKSPCCSKSFPAFDVVSDLDVSHSNSCSVVSQSCFNLQVFDDVIVEHLLFVCHLNIFIGEVQIFSSFLIYVVMNWKPMSTQSLYVETLPTDMMVLGGGSFGGH